MLSLHPSLCSSLGCRRAHYPVGVRSFLNGNDPQQRQAITLQAEGRADRQGRVLRSPGHGYRRPALHHISNPQISTSPRQMDPQQRGREVVRGSGIPKRNNPLQDPCTVVRRDHSLGVRLPAWWRSLTHPLHQPQEEAVGARSED